jgi:enoyl-[acyl-carrier protein] reductase II
LLKNDFYTKVKQSENDCASLEDLNALLGKARAKKGMFEGDLTEGELEIGQVSSLIDNIKPAKDVVHEIWAEFNSLFETIQRIN